MAIVRKTTSSRASKIPTSRLFFVEDVAKHNIDSQVRLQHPPTEHSVHNSPMANCARMKYTFAVLLGICLTLSGVRAAEPPRNSPVACMEEFLRSLHIGDKGRMLKCCVHFPTDKRLTAVTELFSEVRLLLAYAEKATKDPSISDSLLELLQLEHLSSRSIETTMERMSNIDVKYRGTSALLTIKWKKSDPGKSDPFLYSTTPVRFKKSGSEWLLDCGDDFIFTNEAEVIGNFRKLTKSIKSVRDDLASKKNVTNAWILSEVKTRCEINR